ncbi:MAG: ABC transporter ATP-binding protein [Asgard group archaeon]|nr:ABC transporter ATP-binding protein [Asgard group archaeon]
MIIEGEPCDISDTILGVSKQQLITNKYRSARHWFWSGLRRYPGIFLVSIFFLLMSSILGLVPSIFVGWGIDIFTAEGFSITFLWIGLSIIIGAVINWATSFFGSYIWSVAAFRIERDVRQEFFEVIQEHSMAFHDENDSGVLLSMGMNEVAQIRLAYQPAFRLLLSTFLNIALACVYFFVKIPIGTRNIGVGVWEIGLGVTAIFILYFILAWRYASKIGPVRRELSTELGRLSSASQEVFRGIEVVRSFDKENTEENKFRIINDNYADYVKKEGFLSSFYWPSLLIVIAMGISFGVGIYLIPLEVITSGDLAAMLTLLFSLLTFNFMVPMRLLMLQAGLVNAQRIWDIITYRDLLEEPPVPLVAEWDKNIIFNNVSFKYPNTEKFVLKNINFTIPPGSRVALIGGPGSGKSSILKLLLRLYDTTEGDIILNGCALRDMATIDVRRDITLVEQDIFLFSASIKDNIAFSKPNATFEEIRIAARRAQALNFIEASPDGFDTPISERGVTLSGGQRQRIAIARALLADPKLLLLDDSTSAVDVKTEARLRLAMEELIKGRTSIIVTQRLSTLVESDLIIFLEKGEIVDIGSHQELLARCPKYQFMLSYLPSGSQIDEVLKTGGVN